MEIAGDELRTLSMDHHGLVAAICKELGLSEKIDSRLDKGDERRKVSAGKAVVAMILNGLGFTNRRLYLSHQFFENKPVERLLGAPIEAKDITDYTLGHTLDEIYEYGSSQLFGEIAFEMTQENNLLDALNHIDTTSLSVHGSYEQGDSSAVEITYGYSKDHRPDLKQVVLSLVVNGPSAIPLWMEPQDGNSSDKKSFHETIKRVQAFKQQLDLETPCRWVGDSALYSKEHLLKETEYLWLTRVPETLRCARQLIEKPMEEITWSEQDRGYQVASFGSDYGDVKQRWLLVFSKQAYEREKKTLDRKLSKQEEALEKAAWHLGNEVFQCESDAKKAADKLSKQYRYHQLNYEILPVERYERRGKPRVGDKKQCMGYQVKSLIQRNESAINAQLNKKGRFILATNDLDKEHYRDSMMLEEYKSQQKVERGFRFIKDPWFMVDSIFLKSNKRIEALMMVMTLCLFVYNYSQYRLREALRNSKETLPNQLGKPIQNPTMRWVFQLMEGIGIVRFYTAGLKRPLKEMLTNLNSIRKKIIMLFGEMTCQMYGLVPDG